MVHQFLKFGMKEELLKSDRHTCLSMLIKHLVTFFLIEQIKPNVVFCSGEPLIFIEVALMKDVAATIQVKVLTLFSLTLSLLTSIKDSLIIAGGLMGQSSNF